MKIIRLKAVIEMTGLARSTIYLHMKGGHFPKPIKLGAKSVGWLEDELFAWIEDRKNERA